MGEAAPASGKILQTGGASGRGGCRLWGRVSTELGGSDQKGPRVMISRVEQLVDKFGVMVARPLRRRKCWVQSPARARHAGGTGCRPIPCPETLVQNPARLERACSSNVPKF